MTARRAAMAIAVLSLALLALGAGFGLAEGDLTPLVGGLFLTAFPIVGVVIIRVQPRNIVAWVFLAAAMCHGLGASGEHIAQYGLAHHWPRVVSGVAGWFQAWTWFPAVFLLATIALLRFPDNRLVGRGWRWVEYASYLANGVWAVAVSAAATTIPTRQLIATASPTPTGWVGVVFHVGESMFFLVALCVLASLASLVMRYRRGTTVAREQIRWVLSAAALSITASIVEQTISGTTNLSTSQVNWMQTIVESVGYALIAVATGVAITRYKLYEIDRIVSRTVTYAVVLIALAALYVGVLVALAQLVPTDLGQVGVAAATLVVSVVAVPLTRRVRRAVDHRFNRSRFDAERVATAFAARLRARPERGDVPADLIAVVHRTVQPAHASVWLLDRDGVTTSP
jgi:hypothetical protein